MLSQRELDPISEGDEIYSPPPTHPVLVVAVLALLGLAILGSVQWWISEAGLADGANTDDKVAVPRLVGSSEQAAVDLLVDAGFEVDTIHVPNVRAERGIVFDQDPVAGEMGAPGSSVTITVSTGGDYVVVPEITGSLVEQIGLQLYEYELGVGQVASRQDRNSLAGEILEQFPPPGEEVAVGSLVDVVVSEGPPPVNVPDVRGLSEGEAARILRAAGFQVVSVRTYSSARSGTVVSTNPRADAEAPYGSEIRVVVSRGSAPTTVPPRPPTTPEPTDPAEPPTTPSTPPTPRPPGPPPPSGQGGGSQGDGP